MNAAPAGQFLIYEEHSIYRREFLSRADTAADANARAARLSRRSALPISVRHRQSSASPATFVAFYRSGRCVVLHAAAKDQAGGA